MGRAVGDDDHVTLGDRAAFAVFGFPAADFFRLDGLAVHDRAAGDERRGAFEHVDDIRVACVHLDDAGFIAMTGVDLVIHSPNQRYSFDERLIHLLCRQVCDGRRRRSHRGLEGGSAGDRDVLIFLRRISAYADGADHFAIGNERHTALKGCRSGKREGGNTPVLNLVFEDFTRATKTRRGAGFTDTYVDARHLSVVETLQHQWIAAVVNDHDNDG